jgi:two-component system response regulator HydG
MPTVLIVDDQLAMAETLADSLGARGHQAIATSSGHDAVSRLQAGGIDLLITDLRMPEIDGMKLLQISRSLDPERPVIVMTAYEALDGALECMRRGAYHYLTKPFRAEILEILVERGLAERRTRAEAAALRELVRTLQRAP